MALKDVNDQTSLRCPLWTNKHEIVYFFMLFTLISDSFGFIHLKTVTDFSLLHINLIILPDSIIQRSFSGCLSPSHHDLFVKM